MGYPLLINKNLLRNLVTYWVKSLMKVVDDTSFPDIELEGGKPIHFIFPEFPEGAVKGKMRKLHRINDEVFNWNIEVFGEVGPERKKIFPVETLR